MTPEQFKILAAEYNRIQVRQRRQRQFRQILSVGKTVEGRVDVSSRIGHQLNFADVEFSTRRVM